MWMMRSFDLDFVDTITETGANRVLSGGTESEIAELRRKTRLSIQAHGSSVIGVVGHHDCATNQISDNEHKAQIKESVRVVENWNYPARVIGLWVNSDWQVEVVVPIKIRFFTNELTAP